MSSLESKTVLVTGGAGPDMGRLIVTMCLDAGAHVIAVDASEKNLESLAADRPDVIAVHADISQPAEVDRAVAAGPGPVDVLFNHAGICDKIGVVDVVDDADWDRVMNVNLRAPFLFSKRVLPSMVERGGGIIVNTASVSGLRGARGGAAYTASKFGVVGLTLHIAATYGSRGIRCNAVAPGGMGSKPDPNKRVNHFTDRGLELLSRDRGKPDTAPAEQVASVAYFLATDAAQRLNGAVIPVDGGWIAY
jgi:NAD(P)-dependent dehydrogenase (short-subunit alcohol dehydrogenase family)